MASILAQEYQKKVLIVEADFKMPTYTLIFSELSPDIYLNDYLERNDHLRNYIYQDNRHSLDVVFAFPSYRPSDKIHNEDRSNFGWFMNNAVRLQEDLSSLEYDYVIFDLAPGNHFFSVLTLKISNEILIMVRGNNESILGTKNLFEDIYVKMVDTRDQESKNLRVVINQIPKGDEIDFILSQKNSKLIQNYRDLISSSDYFEYENETDYFIFQSDLLFLPSGNPTYQRMKEFVESYYL